MLGKCALTVCVLLSFAVLADPYVDPSGNVIPDRGPPPNAGRPTPPQSAADHALLQSEAPPAKAGPCLRSTMTFVGATIDQDARNCYDLMIVQKLAASESMAAQLQAKLILSQQDVEHWQARTKEWQ